MTALYSWNVNGIRAAVRYGFLEWLREAQPDILCIQESRIGPGELDPAIAQPEGYKTFWQPAQRKGYSGVAAFVKEAPRSVEVMGVDEFDREGRVQVLRYDPFTVVNTYFPNSQPEGARLDYKLAFCTALLELCQKLRAGGANVIVCGDFNIAHTEIDLARPAENENNPGFFPQERAAMDTFLGAGYVDTFRQFTKEGGHYTWWSYQARARERNVGWRIDYHCVNTEFMPHVKESVILAGVMGSDHCPVALTVE